MSEARQPRRRWRISYLLVGAVVFYVAAIAGAWFVGAEYARESQDDILSSEINSMEIGVETGYSRILAFVANRLVDRFASARACSCDEMRRLAGQYGVDEFNIADSNGVCIASSEAAIVGTAFGIHAETQCYSDLLSGRLKVLTQNFRASVDEPNIRRKYLAQPFPDGSGFIQLGIDETRVDDEYEKLFFDYFSSWTDGRYCFYIVADEDSGLISEYSYARNMKEVKGRTLAEIGFTNLAAEPDGTIRHFGEICRYRSLSVFGKRFVVLVREDDFSKLRLLFVLLPAVLLALMYAIVAWFMRNLRRARRAELHLRAVRLRQDREERQRQVDDLLLARDIQRSSLPSVFPPFPRDLTIDLFADMAPARDVGGDFYDFFYIGPGRLAVLVADVSGKGVPAAMFMMKAKSILRELALSMSDLCEVVAKANDHLCEGNEADMFVTCWIGVLEEGTGELHYVNAGHNPPYLCRADGSFAALRKVSGLFLGGMSGVRYRTFTVPVRPGDLLFLYTDGVTEANNVLGEFFGESRLEEVLVGHRGLGLARFRKDQPELMAPRQLCQRVRGAVDAFAGKAAQFDDITLLALRYRGRPEVRRLELPAQLESVPKFSSFAETCLVEVGCAKAAKADLLVALDEVTNNVAQYSGSERMTVMIETARNPSVARFTIIDSGTPWNPLEHLDPDITLSADERAIGGLGILMVKKLMDDVSYAYEQGCNIFRFRKQIA